jgi:outer membrane protein insertion porin family
MQIGVWLVSALLVLSGPIGADGPIGLPLRSVDLQCDAWVDEEGLVEMLPLQVGAPLSEEQIEESRRRLELTQIFRSIELIPKVDGDVVDMLIRLRRKPVISHVKLVGYHGMRLPELRWVLHNISGGRLGGWKQNQLRDVEIQRLVRLRVGIFYEPELLEVAAERVIDHYYRKGFAYTQVATRVTESPGQVRVEAEIMPGEPIVITSVRCFGELGLSADDLAEAVSKFEGKNRERGILREIRMALLRRLREGGFYEARVSAAWVWGDHLSGTVETEIRAGPHFVVTIDGNENVSDQKLRDSLDLSKRLVVTDGTWRLMARRIHALYQAAGFYEAEVTVATAMEEGEKQLRFSVREGDKFYLRTIQIDGNQNVADDTILAQMITRKRRRFPWPRRGALVSSDLEEDMERVRALYSGRGFESADVRPQVTVGEPGHLHLLISVEEGPQTIITELEPPGLESRLPSGVTLQSRLGTPLSGVALEADRRALLKALRQLGHQNARVQVEIDRVPADDRVDAVLHWVIEPGPRYRIGPIIVQGNVETRDEVILRVLPFESGDPLDTGTLLRGQEQVHGLGLFRTATVQEVEESEIVGPPRPGEAVSGLPEEQQAGESEKEDAGEVTLPVTVQVTSRPPGRLSFGLGYNTRDGVTGFAETTFDNVFRRAHKLRVRGQMSIEPPNFEPDQYLGLINYIDPRFRGGAWEVQFNLLGERNTQSLQKFSVERGAFGSSISRLLRENLSFGGSWQVEYVNAFDVEPEPFEARDERNAWAMRLGTFLVYDGRNDILNPTSGFLQSLRLSYAPPGISTIDFTQIDAQHTHFIPLWKEIGFVYTLRAGWVRTYDDPIPPIWVRYFVGGGESVRGFKVNSLGPYDGEGDETGGDLALVGKAELRVPLLWGFGFILFVDGGGNFLLRCDSECRRGDPDDASTRVSDAQFSFDNLRSSAGFGFRYVSPVGPISVDYGIKLDRRTRTLVGGRRDKESFGEFSISIGTRF